jgi:hypothetical protein
MTQAVMHNPRVAWDGARTIARALESGFHPWLAYVMGERLGDQYRNYVIDSFNRLNAQPDRIMVECGIWRVYLQTLLEQGPETRDVVVALLADTEAALRS